MGLDMYAYRVQNPSLDPGKVYTRQDLQGEHMILLPDKASSDRYQQVLPYAQKLRVISQYYDLEKIRADFQIPDAEVWMTSAERIGIRGTVNGAEATRYIITEQVNALYTVEREEECFVFAAAEVAYWRKEYDLQELIDDSLGGIVRSMGFYLLDRKTVDSINRYNTENGLTEFIEWFEPTETSALFYYEWY